MRWWFQPPCLLQTVIVNLADDPTTALRGALWAVHGSWLVLRQAELLKTGLPPTTLDGEIIVHRSKVAFLQAL